MWAIEFAGKGLIKEHMFVPVEGSPAGGAFTADEPKRFERARCTRATGCSEVLGSPRGTAIRLGLKRTTLQSRIQNIARSTA